MSGWLGRLVVGLVLCLISFIAYSSQIFIIWPWYGSALSIPLLVLLVPFNLLVAILFWNYFLCVNVDPGRVPDSWRPDTHADGFEVKKLTGAPRYCRMCNKYKPPRTHHCRQCNRCVLRMDHHCPWINNCVGHYNYGHFIRFLFYVDVACSYHVAMVTRRVFVAMNAQYWDEPNTTELIFIILNYVCCIPVLLAVGGFSIYHFFGLMGNTTTIEGWEKDKAAMMYRKGKITHIKYPYNLGRRKNIESVLGKRPMWWCWPTVTPGNGLRYEVVASEDPEPPEWPPKDPTAEGFKLPDSPWTYENGSYNPNLRPSNTLQNRRVKKKGLSSLPPYHPDYVEGDDPSYESYEEMESSGSSSEDDYNELRPRHKVRRGSEGYEIRPVDREDMLRRYLEDIDDSELERRYNRYEPEPMSESSGESGDEDRLED